MLQGIAGDHDISHIDIFIKSACHAGIDNHVHLVDIHQNLRADRHIDLAHTALYHNCLLIPECTVIKCHPCQSL